MYAMSQLTRVGKAMAATLIGSSLDWSYYIKMKRAPVIIITLIPLSLHLLRMFGK